MLKGTVCPPSPTLPARRVLDFRMKLDDEDDHAHGPHSAPPFTQERNVKIVPFYRERAGSEKKDALWNVFVDVTVDIQSSLTTSTSDGSRQSTASSSFRHRIVTTPFPKDVIRLLTKYRVYRILLQTGSSSSSSFPSTVLEDVETGSDHGAAPTGPSGVSVRVQFVLNGHDDHAYAVARFLALLHELVDQRWILAPLDTITSPRLHRVIFPTTHQQHQHQHPLQILELETILPMDGSAVSAEGMQAFFLRGHSNTCPSPNPSEDWDTSVEWSSLLLGTSTQPSVSTLADAVGRRRRRSMWLDMQASSSCHDNDMVEVMDASDKEPCRMTISHGIQYAAMIESKSLPQPQQHQQPSRTKPKKKKKHNRILLDDTILPRNMLQRFGWCHPHSIVTRLEWVVPDAWNGTWPSVNASSTLVKSPPSATPGFARRIYEFAGLGSSLPPKSWLTVKPPPFSSSNLDKNMQSFLPPIWTIERTIQRPRGVAMDGTLLTRVAHHPRDDEGMTRCTIGVVAQVMEVWPNYIRPRWRSLQAQLLSKHETTDQTPRNIQQTTDGSILIQWHVPMLSTDYSSFFISVDYDYVLMNFEDFPADPNRGMELPPSVVTFSCASASNTTPTPYARLYSEALLIMPPVPDMSMPFNILSLTSTLYAFCIGGLVNLLIRKSSERLRRQYDAATETKKTSKPSIRDRIRDKLLQSNLGKFIWPQQPTITETEISNVSNTPAEESSPAAAEPSSE